MITRTLVDFTRNPGYFINNMDAINDLIIYYIDNNSKLLFNNNIDIVIDKKLYINKIHNIKNNLKKHTLNEQINNIYSSNKINETLIQTLIDLLKMNDMLLSNIQTKLKTKTVITKPDTQDINILLLNNYFNNNDNSGIIQIINDINNINDDDIDKLLNLLINKIKYINFDNNSYIYSSTIPLNINNINITNNILNPIIIEIIDRYLLYCYDIKINSGEFNKSLLFWRSLQIYYQYDIFLSSSINKEIKKKYINNRSYLLFNLHSMLLGEKFINDMILFIDLNKYNKLNTIPKKLLEFEDQINQDLMSNIHQIKNKLSFDFL